jgi:hypothetical protein
VHLVTLRGLGYLLKAARRGLTQPLRNRLQHHLVAAPPAAAGHLLPVLALIALNTWSLYRKPLASLHTAYDRTLLASAKSISEQLDVHGYDEQAQLRAIVPYSALEIFEADNQSRMFYRVSTPGRTVVSGFRSCPSGTAASRSARPMRAGGLLRREFRGHPVRVAVLLQPVASATGRGMAVIQVAETLELRERWPADSARHAVAPGPAGAGRADRAHRGAARHPARCAAQPCHRQRPQGDLSPWQPSAVPRGCSRC